MKIPYVVSANTREAFATSKVMCESAPEINRMIIAENFEWDDEVTPKPLSYLCAVALSKIFHRLNPINNILQKDRDILMDLYTSYIPLPCSAPQIPDEQYWKRCFEEQFPSNIDLSVSFWKGKYLSACLQRYLETTKPNVFIEEEAIILAKLVSPYIFELKITQLKMILQPKPEVYNPDVVVDCCPFSVQKLFDHIPLEPVLTQLYNLRELSLVFEQKNLEENYHSRYYEISEGDCVSLSKGLIKLPHIRCLRINRSKLTSSRVKIILEYLVNKETIEELDFNHCKIGDYGMKALGGFISLHKNVKIVRIANNCFKEEGVQGIAYALQMKPAAPIELLDFSLNQMSLQCATMFAAAFVRMKDKPQTLIVNSCGFRGPAAEKMTGLLYLNRGLTRFDLAANDLSGEAETTLIQALTRNKKLLTMDLRRTNVSDETLAKVEELLKRNKELLNKELEPSDEIPPLYLNEPEYLIWEYNPNNPDYIPGRYPVRVAEV